MSSQGRFGELTTEQELILYEVFAYIVCLVASALSLRLLIRLARDEMRPRPQYTRIDYSFTKPDEGQNWSWDWCFVFSVRRDDRDAEEEIKKQNQPLLFKCLSYLFRNETTTSTESYDVSEDDAELGTDKKTLLEEDFAAQYTLRKVVERLENSGLETKLYRSFDRSMIIIKIRASAERLKEEAARTEYKLLLDGYEIRQRMKHGYRDEVGRYKWYPRKKNLVLKSDDGRTESRFDTQIEDERNQSPYQYYDYIYGPYKEPKMANDLSKAALREHTKIYHIDRVSNSMFRTVDRLKLMKSIIEADVKTHGASLNIAKLLAKKAMIAAFPLHSISELTALQDKWLNYRTAPWQQPLDEIKDYFGEKIALYFAFLGHYTTWLFAAALVGALVTIVHLASNDLSRGVTPLFAVFISLWATLFLEAWKGVQAKYAMMWGMSDFESIEQTRPEFHGIEIQSPVTGLPEVYYPPAAQLRGYILSYTVVFLALFVVLAVLSAAFVMQAYLSNRPVATHLDIVAGEGNGRSLGLFLSHLIMATTTYFGVDMFKPVGEFLNTLENHRTETQFEDNLIAKVFVFRFVVAYGPLFYIGAAQSWLATVLHFQRADCFYENCFSDLSQLLATIFIYRVVVGNVQEVVIPTLRQMEVRQKRRGNAIDKKKRHMDTAEYIDPADPEKARRRQTSHIEEQFLRDDYHHLLGTFDDYAEMITQFGYATLFSTAFPLAPLFSFINNYIEIRFDGWKLCQNTRRAWPTGAQDIGTWQTVLSFMSVLATLTNSLLVAYTGATFQDLTMFERLLIFTLFEYALLGVKAILMLVVDDTPPAVEMQMERQTFLISKIILNVADERKEVEDDDDDNAALDWDQSDAAKITVHASDPGLVLVSSDRSSSPSA